MKKLLCLLAALSTAATALASGGDGVINNPKGKRAEVVQTLDR